MRPVTHRGTKEKRGILAVGSLCALTLATAATSTVGADPQAAASPAVTTATLRSAAPTGAGLWSTAIDPGTDVVGIAAVLLHTGKVVLFGSLDTSGEDMTNTAYVYDPKSRTGHDLATPVPVFCGAVVQLDDDRLLSVGGADPIPHGLPDIWLFDPATEKWTRQPDTKLGRYYPTLTRLPSGRVLITAGTEADGVTPNPTVEIYTPPPRGRSVGTLKVVGGDHATSFYPRQWVMPDGKVLQISGTRSYRFDPKTSRWRSMGRLPARAGEGAAGLMLPGGPRGSTRVLSVGGRQGANALAATESFDYAHPAAGWSLGTPLPQPRAHVNLVQVPSGAAFGVGGNTTRLYDGPVLRTLRYNPATARWTRMAVQSIRRAYHSTALLLPDGRIMSAGDTGVGGGGALIDFYSPAYLFLARHPRITWAPARVRYGTRFTIRTSGATATRAVLMAPSATTHSDEMNARHVTLAVRRHGKRITARVPRPAVAPPGYYMLFVLARGGAPSKASWIHLGR